MKFGYYKSISEKMTFRRAGCDYKNIVFDEEHHCGIWKMSKEIDGVVKDMGYEVVKGLKRKNSDGSIVYVYPEGERFGIYGFYTYSLERCKEIFDSWIAVKDQRHFKDKDDKLLIFSLQIDFRGVYDINMVIEAKNASVVCIKDGYDYMFYLKY